MKLFVKTVKPNWNCEDTHLVFLAPVPVGSSLVPLFLETELLVPFVKGVRVWLLVMVALRDDAGQVCVPPLGVGLHPFLGHFKRLHGACHQPEKEI